MVLQHNGTDIGSLDMHLWETCLLKQADRAHECFFLYQNNIAKVVTWCGVQATGVTEELRMHACESSEGIGFKG